MLFLSEGYPLIFSLFHLFLGIEAAVRMLNVEKANSEDSKVPQTIKYPIHSMISPK